MSRREKFLVITLAAVIVLLGGFKLLVEPQIKNVALAKSELAQVLNDKNRIEQNSLQSAIIKDNNAKLESLIEQATIPFFPEIQTDKIHIFFQGLADKAGIRYHSFTMTNRTVSQIAPHQIIDTNFSYPAKNAAEEIKKLEGTDNQTPSAETSDSKEKLIEMITVSLQFEGSYQNSLALLDEINNSGRLVRISSLRMNKESDNQLSVSITAECYGILKFTGRDNLALDTLSKPSGKADPFK
jgi:Tfp pilus assembly protein PilO